MASLTWLLIFMGMCLLFLTPRLGLLAIFRAWRAARERELLEDALKHLLERQQLDRPASPESLAGLLGISRAAATGLIEVMESQDLIESDGSALRLTPTGEHWALHVVRAHRLWERFLADEARMPLVQIHGEAHRREHKLTEAQLNDLDAALGYPTHDPHGDPIPSRDGSLPSTKATPLTSWQGGQPAQIVHLEDEPAIAYEQIVASGLRLGQTIRILDRTPRRITVSDGENEYHLAPAVATNVHVAALAGSQALRRNAIPLSEVERGQRAEIVFLDEAVQGFTRRRFLDLGLTPGTAIYPELQTAFGDPRGYRVRGTLIALRKEQAAGIWVKLSGPKNAEAANLHIAELERS